MFDENAMICMKLDLQVHGPPGAAAWRGTAGQLRQPAADVHPGPLGLPTAAWICRATQARRVQHAASYLVLVARTQSATEQP